MDTIQRSAGRSILVMNNSPIQAWATLKNIIQKSNLRSTIKAQERFEKPHDMRRRKKRERLWRVYRQHVDEMVRKAISLKKSHELEKKEDRRI
jgi:ribosomal protein S21